MSVGRRALVVDSARARTITQRCTQRLRPKRVERLLRAHRIRRLSADDVVSTLQALALQVAPGVVEAATEHIALLLPRLRLVHSQRQRCGARMEALLDEFQAADEEDHKPGEHSDVAILRSLPGVGRIVAATIIAEACAALTERNYDALRAHAEPSRRSPNKVASTALS